jgi:hypothetical protein
MSVFRQLVDCSRVCLSPQAGRGLAPYALTFGMETREDTVHFRRQTLVSGIIGRSAVNRPPPRKTVLILIGGQSVRAPPVRTRSSSCPVPTPRGDSHHGPLARVIRGILRVHQNRYRGSTELEPRRSPTRERKCTHVVSSRQWGRPPPGPPRRDVHHGPLPGSSPGTPSSPSRSHAEARGRDWQSLPRTL